MPHRAIFTGESAADLSATAAQSTTDTIRGIYGSALAKELLQLEAELKERDAANLAARATEGTAHAAAIAALQAELAAEREARPTGHGRSSSGH